MLAEALARRLARRGVHYGWAIAAVTFLTMLTTAGAVGLPGAFILPLSKEFGWDAAQISGPLAVRLILFGLMAPFAAALIERFGVRNVVVSAIGLIVAGLLLALTMSAIWQLFIYWGIVIGVGTGLTAMVFAAIVSNRWFNQRRGLVLGMLTAANSTGQLVFLPLAAWLIDHVGWRYALAPSIGALVLAGLLILLLMRDRPSDLGLAPYGDPPLAPGGAPAPPAPAPAIGRAFSVLAECSRSGAFWVLFFTFYVCGLSTNGLIQTHFISFCVDFGLPAVAAASTLAMMGLFDIAGTIGSGWLSDRYDSRALLFWYYGLRGLSLLYLPYSGFTVYGLSIFSVFYGLDWIATVPPTVKLATQTFGKEKAAVAFGWIFAAHQLGAATAAFGAGFSRTEWSTYVPAFLIAGAACLFASASVWLIGARKQAPATAAA
ncbi:MAG TPA: MFS transporter [Roseiarcus sp.]|nr:MFS transporter [Roseiarcus sp.]